MALTLKRWWVEGTGQSLQRRPLPRAGFTGGAMPYIYHLASLQDRSRERHFLHIETTPVIAPLPKEQSTLQWAETMGRQLELLVGTEQRIFV